MWARITQINGLPLLCLLLVHILFFVVLRWVPVGRSCNDNTEEACLSAGAHDMIPLSYTNIHSGVLYGVVGKFFEALCGCKMTACGGGAGEAHSPISFGEALVGGRGMKLCGACRPPARLLGRPRQLPF